MLDGKFSCPLGQELHNDKNYLSVFIPIYTKFKYSVMRTIDVFT